MQCAISRERVVLAFCQCLPFKACSEKKRIQMSKKQLKTILCLQITSISKTEPPSQLEIETQNRTTDLIEFIKTREDVTGL